MKRKIGIFFISLLPMLLAIGVQVGLEFFAAGIGFLLYQLGLAPFSSAQGVISLFRNQDFLAVIMIMYTFFVMIFYPIVYYRYYEGKLLPDSKKRNNIFIFGGICLMVPAAQFLVNLIAALTAVCIPGALEAYTELMETAGFDENVTVWLALYAVFFGPIAEELIFRGLTYKSLRRIMGFGAANFVQAVLFGIYHMNVLQGIYAFALGLLFGYVCEYGGSIYLSIILHILFNAWGTFVTQFFENVSDITIILLYGISFLVMGLAVLLFKKGYDIKNSSDKYSVEPQ